ncbi:MAG: hypothetical protein U1F77_06100 [Kiritimatiellia bacterium]
MPNPSPRHLAFLTSDLRPLTSSSLLFLFACLLSFIPASATPPAWWSTRGVITTNAVPNDFAPVNAGQLQNMARALYEEIEFRVPNGPSPALFSHLSDLLAATNHYAVINLGQLKHTVKPFYDFLAPFGGPAVPWPAPGLTANDFAPANLGQLKNVFALDIAAIMSAPAASGDPDGDGLVGSEDPAPNTPNLVMHGAGEIVVRGTGIFRSRPGWRGALNQKWYLGVDSTDSLRWQDDTEPETSYDLTWTDTVSQSVDLDGAVQDSEHIFTEEIHNIILGETWDFYESQTNSNQGVLYDLAPYAGYFGDCVGGLTDGLYYSSSAYCMNNPWVLAGYTGWTQIFYKKPYADVQWLNHLRQNLEMKNFPSEWGTDEWSVNLAGNPFTWGHGGTVPSNPSDPSPYRANSAVKFVYPVSGSDPATYSAAIRRLQFALRVENPIPGAMYVRRGVFVLHPQNDLNGPGTVIGTFSATAQGGAGGGTVVGTTWIKEISGGTGELRLVEAGSYLNFDDVAEENENTVGAKVIPVGGTAIIRAGVGCNDTAQSLRTKFHLRQGDPAHATVKRVGPPLTPVPWDTSFDPCAYSSGEYQYSADAPGVYVVEQITTATVNGAEVEVDREGVTVTVVDFTKLHISSTDTPPRTIEDTTTVDEPRTAANTLVLCEGANGFATLNIQGWWEPGAAYNAECKWMIQVMDDSSGAPSGRWESGYGTFSANPAESIFNGNTAGNGREFKVTGWYDCNSDGVLDPGEPSRQVFVIVIKVDLDGLRVYDPKLENAGDAEIKYKIVGPASGFTPRLELTVMDGAAEVASIVRKTDASPAISTEITKNWDGKWGVKKDGTDTVHKGKLADPKQCKMELKVYESATATTAICTKEYDLYVARLGVLEMGLLDDQEVTYHKKKKDDTDNYQFTDNSGFAKDVVWKIEHIDFLKSAGPVSRTEARKEQTPTGESYADTDNATGRTGAEQYFDEDGDGGYTAGLRQANFPPQTPTANKDKSNGIENARYNRPAVYVRNSPVKIWFKFGTQAKSDVTLADCAVGYPVAAHPIWVVGKFGGADMGRDNTDPATDGDAIRNINPASGPYKLKSTATLANTVGYDVETIEFTFKYNKKGESYEDTNGNGAYDAGETIIRDNGNGTYDEELVHIPGKQTTTHLVYRLANSPHYASMDFSARPAPFNEKLEQLFLKIVDFTCAWGQAAGAGTANEVFASYWNNGNFWTPFLANGAPPALKPDNMNGFKGTGDPTEKAQPDAWGNSPMCYTYRHDRGAGQTVNGWLDDNYARCGGWSPVFAYHGNTWTGFG